MSASSFFLYTGTRRAFFQSVKVSPRYAQYENRPVKGETMAGSASFNNFGAISSGPADRMPPNVKHRCGVFPEAIKGSCNKGHVVSRIASRPHLLTHHAAKGRAIKLT